MSKILKLIQFIRLVTKEIRPSEEVLILRDELKSNISKLIKEHRKNTGETVLEIKFTKPVKGSMYQYLEIKFTNMPILVLNVSAPADEETIKKLYK